jgi:hypothetical protein
VPKVGLELHSIPCKHWAPAETCGIRPDPTHIRPNPKPNLWTLSTHQFRCFEAFRVAVHNEGARFFFAPDFEAEIRATFASVEKLLADIGLGLDDVVRCIIYLTDFNDFAEMDQIFRDICPANPPVRATVGVAGLARDCKFEVEVTATR